jgi:acyl-CoA reductase-like NAD-dependent aldehyde dehydrogenase
MHPFKDHGDWKMLIGGDFVRGSGAAALQITNPATGKVLGEVPSGSKKDVSDAVTAAKQTYRDWRWIQPEKRGEMLFAIADAIHSHLDELVDIETWENGKPRAQCVMDVLNAERIRCWFPRHVQRSDRRLDRFRCRATRCGYSTARTSNSRWTRQSMSLSIDSGLMMPPIAATDTTAGIC